MGSVENRGASKGQERKLRGIRLGEICVCVCVRGGWRLVSLVSESERFSFIGFKVVEVRWLRRAS